MDSELCQERALWYLGNIIKIARPLSNLSLLIRKLRVVRERPMFSMSKECRHSSNYSEHVRCRQKEENRKYKLELFSQLDQIAKDLYRKTTTL